MTKSARPEIVEDAHLQYLDTVRRLGFINMFESPMYLAKEFGLTMKEARSVVAYWMENFKSEDGE